VRRAGTETKETEVAPAAAVSERRECLIYGFKPCA